MVRKNEVEQKEQLWGFMNLERPSFSFIGMKIEKETFPVCACLLQICVCVCVASNISAASDFTVFPLAIIHNSQNHSYIHNHSFVGIFPLPPHTNALCSASGFKK